MTVASASPAGGRYAEGAPGTVSGVTGLVTGGPGPAGGGGTESRRPGADRRRCPAAAAGVPRTGGRRLGGIGCPFGTTAGRSASSGGWSARCRRRLGAGRPGRRDPGRGSVHGRVMGPDDEGQAHTDHRRDPGDGIAGSTDDLSQLGNPVERGELSEPGQRASDHTRGARPTPRGRHGRPPDRTGPRHRRSVPGGPWPVWPPSSRSGSRSWHRRCRPRPRCVRRARSLRRPARAGSRCRRTARDARGHWRPTCPSQSANGATSRFPSMGWLSRICHSSSSGLPGLFNTDAGTLSLPMSCSSEAQRSRSRSAVGSLICSAMRSVSARTRSEWPRVMRSCLLSEAARARMRSAATDRSSWCVDLLGLFELPLEAPGASGPAGHGQSAGGMVREHQRHLEQRGEGQGPPSHPVGTDVHDPRGDDGQHPPDPELGARARLRDQMHEQHGSRDGHQYGQQECRNADQDREAPARAPAVLPIRPRLSLCTRGSLSTHVRSSVGSSRQLEWAPAGRCPAQPQLRPSSRARVARRPRFRGT